MGNDHRYHAGMLEVMRAHPGVVVFHDFALQTSSSPRPRARDARLYLEEVAACHGAEARREAAEALARGGTPSMIARPLDFPLNRRLAAGAEAIIVPPNGPRALREIAPAVPSGTSNAVGRPRPSTTMTKTR